MKIFYVHHALRDKGNPPSQNDGITELGRKDADIVAEIFEELNKKFKVKAIYSSEHFRCKETARIINKHLSVQILEDSRLNEFVEVENLVKGKPLTKKEMWKNCQQEIVDFLGEILENYDDKDAVICVTSGVNISAFIAFAYGIEPSENMPFPLVPSCSPIGFDINKQ